MQMVETIQRAQGEHPERLLCGNRAQHRVGGSLTARGQSDPVRIGISPENSTLGMS